MAFNLTATINAQLNPASVVSSIQDLQSRLRANSNKIAVPVKITVSGTKADQINKINTAFIALNKTLPTTNIEVNKVAAAFVNLKAAMSGVNSVNQQLTATNTNIANSSKQVTKQITQAKDAVFEFGRISGLAFRRAAGYTIAATALYGTGRAIASSLKEAIEFQNEMVKISQITGQSVVSLKSLRDEVFRLATTWGVSSKEILNTAQILAQAGLSAKDTQLALEALTKTSLSATFGNMQETADGAVAAMAQFKIGAKDLEKALGSVGAVSAAFAVESEDIIAAIKRTGGVFASLSGNSGVGAGIKSLNEFVAIFSAVRATTRESAESIATGLRTIFTRIQRPATISLLRNFGVELQDAEGKFVGLYKATELLSEGLRRLDTRDPKFAKIVEELGGFRQIGKVIPLLSAYEERQKALQIAQQGGNQLTKDAEKAQESFLVQLTKVREEFNKLINDVSETSTFKAFISLMLTAARTAISVADALKPLIPILGALGGIKLLSLLPRVSRGSFKGVTTLQARHGGYVPELAGGGMPRKRSGHIKDGSVNEDNILAFIGRDEYVLPSETVKRVGVGYLDALRRNEVPGFAKGTDGKTKIKIDDIGYGGIDLVKEAKSNSLKQQIKQSLQEKQASGPGINLTEKMGSLSSAINETVKSIENERKARIVGIATLEKYSKRNREQIQVDNANDGFIRDEQGYKQDFFHGTDKDYKRPSPNPTNVNDSGFFGSGHYNTSDPEYANDYAGDKYEKDRKTYTQGANIRRSHVKARNLAVFNATGQYDGSHGFADDKARAAFTSAREKGLQQGPAGSDEFFKTASKELTNQLKKLGYDGVNVKEPGYDLYNTKTGKTTGVPGVNYKELVTYDPNQVVPATESGSLVRDIGGRKRTSLDTGAGIDQNIANMMGPGFVQEDLGYQPGFQNDDQKAILARQRTEARNQRIADSMTQASQRGFVQEDLGYQPGFQNDDQKALTARQRAEARNQRIADSMDQPAQRGFVQEDLGYQPGFQNDEQKARLAEGKRRQKEIIDQRNAQKASLQQQRDAAATAKQAREQQIIDQRNAQKASLAEQRTQAEAATKAREQQIIDQRNAQKASLQQQRSVEGNIRSQVLSKSYSQKDAYGNRYTRTDSRGLTKNNVMMNQLGQGALAGNLQSATALQGYGISPTVRSGGLPYGPQNQSNFRRRIGSLSRGVKGGLGKFSTGKLSSNAKLGIGLAAGYAGDQAEQAIGGKAGAGLGAGIQGAGLGAAAGLNPVLIAGVAAFSAASAYLAKESEDALNSASDRLAKGFDGLNKALESGSGKDIAKNFDIALSAVNNQVAAQGFAEKNTVLNRAASLFSGTEEIRDPTELDQARTNKSRGKESTSGLFGTDRTATGYADLFNGFFTAGTLGAGGGNVARDSDLFSADYGYRRGKKESDDALAAGTQLKNAFAEQAPALQDRAVSLLGQGKDINDLTFNPLDKNKKSAFSKGETVALASAIADQSELKALGLAKDDPTQQAVVARNIIADNQNELKKIAEIQQATKQAAESYREAAVETERFTDKLDKLKAGFERAATVGDSFRKANDSVTTGFFSQQDNRNVFGNTKAFGTSEIAAEAQKIRASIGRTTTQTVSEQAKDKNGNLIPNKFVERTTTGNTADSFTNAIVGVKQLQEGLPGVVDSLNSQLKNIDSGDPELIKGTQKGIIEGEVNKFTNLPASLRDQVSSSLLAEVDKRGKEGNLDNVDINQILDPIANSVNQAAKAFVDATNRNIGEYESSIKEWVSLQQKANTSRNSSVQLAITNQNKLSTLKGNDLSVSEQDAGYRQQLKNFSQISGTPISQDSLRPQGPARGPIALQQTLGAIDARRGALMASSQGGGDQGEIARQLGELKIQEDAAISALQLMATNTDTLVALENENLKLQRAADAERNAISGKASGSLSEQLKTIQDVTFAEQALANPNAAASIGAMGGEQRQRLDRGLEFLKSTNSEDKDFIRQIEGVESTANSNSLVGRFVGSRRNLSVDEMTDRQAKRGAPYEEIQRAYKRRTDEMEIADQTLANRDQSKANEYGRNARGRYEAEKAAIENPETMIQSFITNLSTVAAQLEKVNIPEKIEFGGTTKVEVLISGAEQMSAMQGELSKLIESKVQGELRRYINQDGSMKQNPSTGVVAGKGK